MIENAPPCACECHSGRGLCGYMLCCQFAGERAVRMLRAEVVSALDRLAPDLAIDSFSNDEASMRFVLSGDQELSLHTVERLRREFLATDVVLSYDEGYCYDSCSKPAVLALVFEGVTLSDP